VELLNLHVSYKCGLILRCCFCKAYYSDIYIHALWSVTIASRSEFRLLMDRGLSGTLNVLQDLPLQDLYALLNIDLCLFPFLSNY
jgi:hypothetical protein